MQRIADTKAQARLRLERARADHGAVDVAIRTFKRYSDDDGGFYAASLTYYTFFSIFPLLALSASIVGYLTFLSDDLRNRLLSQGLKAFPLLNQVLSREGLNTLQERRGLLAVTALIMALYAGSGGIVALEHSLNRINRIADEPGFVAARLRSLRWLGALMAAAVVTVGLTFVASAAGGIVDHPLAQGAVWLFARAGGIAVSTAVFIAAFKLLPQTPQGWRDVLPGALAAGIAFEVLKIVGTWYLERGAQSRQETFGAFAAAAGLLVASYLLSQVILLAAEVNAVLAERRRTRQSMTQPEEEAT